MNDLREALTDYVGRRIPKNYIKPCRKAIEEYNSTATPKSPEQAYYLGQQKAYTYVTADLEEMLRRCAPQNTMRDSRAYWMGEEAMIVKLKNYIRENYGSKEARRLEEIAEELL